MEKMDKDTERMIKEMQEAVDPLVEVAAKVMEKMSTSSVPKSLAKFTHELYTELITQGFSGEQAISIINGMNIGSLLKSAK